MYLKREQKIGMWILSQRPFKYLEAIQQGSCQPDRTCVSQNRKSFMANSLVTVKK